MRNRITPSLVISVLALIVALGGASYAAIQIPKNSVGTKQLKRQSVSAAKLKRNAVVTGKLRNGSVNSAKVRNGSLVRRDFAAGQLPGNTWDVSRDTSTLLDLTGSLETVVETPVLSPSSYVVFARANVLGGAASSTVLCSLEYDAAQNFTVAPNAVFPLSMGSTAILDEARPIKLSCASFAGTPSIAQAHVIATEVPRVTRIPADG